MESLVTQKVNGEPNQNWIPETTRDESGLKEIIAASGISSRLWRLYAYFWLICLIFPILALIQTPPAGWHVLPAVFGLIVFTAFYSWIMWPHPLNDRKRTHLGLGKSLVLILALTILVLLLSLMYGSSFLWLFIGVSAIAGITLSFRNGSITVFALTLLTLGAGIGIHGNIASVDWLEIIPLVLLVRGLGLDMTGFIRLSDALRELHHARQELAHQAVTEERLRMARDLHDLLGHTLSLITLKSELAGRLLEKDPLAATQEIREVERVARQALREVREAVTGYRQQTLRDELDGARQILEAAGISCMVEIDDYAFPSNMDSVISWVVREGVTNVIRHSRARHCLIHITSVHGQIRVEVSNDGSPLDENSKLRWGSGLSGLAERVAGQGGRIEAGALSASRGYDFTLMVEIPVREAR